MDFIILLHKELYNKKSKEQLKEKLNSEKFERITCSFYKYIKIDISNKTREIIWKLLF